MIEMKHLATLLLCTGVLASLQACTEIGFPYEKTSTTPPPTTAATHKKAFVELFTGATCPHCPDGDRVLEGLRSTYDTSLIIMEVHCGSFAEPEPPKYPADFRTAAGEQLKSTFNVSSFPTGVVNREPFGGDLLQARTALASDVDSARKEQATISLNVVPTLTNGGNELSISVSVTALTNFSTTKPLQLAIYIVEDSIIAPQLDNTTYVPNYVHHDVLRDAPLGAFGISLNNTLSWTTDMTASQGAQVNLNTKNWNRAHLKVIALITDPPPTYSVRQSAEATVNE